MNDLKRSGAMPSKIEDYAINGGTKAEALVDGSGPSTGGVRRVSISLQPLLRRSEMLGSPLLDA
jgi:hypothetical protein